MVRDFKTNKKIRYMIIEVKVSDIYENPENPRTLNKKRFEALKKSIKEAMISISSSEHHMFSIPLDVNVNSGNNWDDAH